jgi:hypothetical protein
LFCFVFFDCLLGCGGGGGGVLWWRLFSHAFSPSSRPSLVCLSF